MTTFKHPNGTTFRYDFWFDGQRYTGNTKQITKRDADLVEGDLKKKLRLQAGGLVAPDPVDSPSFQDWAEVYLEQLHTRERGRVTRIDRVVDLLRVVLRFWGRKPGEEATGRWAARADDPYHDLKLRDPIDDPMWILKFEDWMAAKKIAGQTKNQYRSTLSQLYRLALEPAFRKRSGVMMNPFLGVPRDRGGQRTMTITVEELQRWLSHASYHVRIAVAIAALAPKLRLANILALRWRENIDREFRFITVAEHKTAGATGRPLVVPIDEQLRAILQDARKRTAGSKFVVTYRSRRVKTIRGGVQAAAKDAGLTWGRNVDAGVTFHTIRHTMATMLAELGTLDGAAPLSESERMRVMGHQRLETTQRYTHIRSGPEAQALVRLSKQTPIVDIVTHPRTRASRKPPRGTNTGKSPKVGGKSKKLRAAKAGDQKAS